MRDPAPLAAICFFERDEADGDLTLDEQHPPEPRLLLGANFLGYLRSRDHLVDHLTSSTRIAAATRAFTLCAPTPMPPAELAERVEKRFLAALGGSQP